MIVAFEPHLLNEIVHGTSLTTATMLCVSFGYFLYDLVFCIWKLWGEPRTVEYIFHHLAVLFLIFTSLKNQIFIPFLLMAYFQGMSIVTTTVNVSFNQQMTISETQTIFLHTRVMMNLMKFGKTRLAYKFVCIMNILTFILARIIIMVALECMLLYCLFTMTQKVMIAALFAGGCFILVLNLRMFKKLVNAQDLKQS